MEGGRSLRESVTKNSEKGSYEHARSLLNVTDDSKVLLLEVMIRICVMVLCGDVDDDIGPGILTEGRESDRERWIMYGAA